VRALCARIAAGHEGPTLEATREDDQTPTRAR
jgi:hypothetical protein